MSELAVAVSPALLGTPAAHEHPGIHIMDSCLADCCRCGMHNRVFAVTDLGVISCCFSREAGWERTALPSWCQAHTGSLLPAITLHDSPARVAAVWHRRNVATGTIQMQHPLV